MRFQAHAEVLHLLHLNPWAYISWSLAVYSAAVLQYFSTLSVFVDPVSVCLLDFVVTLNDDSHDSADPLLLNFHLHSEFPDSAVFPEEEVQQAVAVDWHVKMNVDILAHVIQIFRLFWNDSPVQLMVMRNQRS